MRMLFLQNFWAEYLGAMYISSALKKNGHDCEVLLCDEKTDFPKKISSIRPDLVAFSCTTGMHRWALGVARNLKYKLNLPIPVIMGGPHPTYFPEVIDNPGIDIVLRGEGEGAIVDLADSIDNNKDITCIPNLWVKKDGRVFKNDVRPLIEDLDTIPFPDRGLYYKYDFLRKNPVKYFITSRGCPYRCAFCFNEPLKKIYQGKGRFVRRRSVDNAIEELIYVKKQYGFRMAEFEDDTLILDRAWIFNFLQRYEEEVDLQYACGFRADLIDDEVARQLKKSGCRAAYFGIESGNELIRNNVLGKSITDEEIINCAGILKKHRVKFGTYNMIGIPGETVKNAIETILMNHKIKTDFPCASIVQLIPHTGLADFALKKGVIEGALSIEDKNPETWFKYSILTQDNIKELINLHKFFYLAVKFPGALILIKLLIRLPANPVFDFIFIVSYALQIIKKTGISPVRLFILGRRSLRFYENL